MSRHDILERLIGIFTQIQEMSGRKVPAINGKTVPLKHLPGFDSLNGIEVTVMLQPKISWNGENLCVSDDGTKALSVNDMVERIFDQINPST